MKSIKTAILICSICFCTAAWGQDVAVKTNTLWWGSATPNLAFEIGWGPKNSLEIAGGWNPWTYKDNKKWKHWLVQPEYRWWFCERFARSFVGVHLHGGEFNVGNTGPFTKTKNYRYEGYFYGAGVSYGHQWILGNRWGLEAEIGVGYARIEYDRFRCGKCEPKLNSGHYNYFGPTRASLSFVYYIR